ncbi:MAG: recombinase family protein [Candidatus Micrarchaeota archaeon]|nr:recombinase family protein [Candidatus Micrarchaeota archaeon]
MRAAIYARVSTDDKGQDVENQLIQLREYCKAKGYEIYREYTEYITGTGKKRRPAFEEMMEDARKRRFDVLLVWSYDRFSRAGLKDIHYISDLNEWGVKFVSYQESFLDTTTEMGELLLPIFAWIAKQEAKKISERTKAGLQRAKSEGKSLGRPKVEINGDIILKLRNEGKSLAEIAEELQCSKETVRRRLMEMAKSNQDNGAAAAQGKEGQELALVQADSEISKRVESKTNEISVVMDPSKNSEQNSRNQ